VLSRTFIIKLLMSISDTLKFLSTPELCGVSIEVTLVVDSNVQGEEMKCRRL